MRVTETDRKKYPTEWSDWRALKDRTDGYASPTNKMWVALMEFLGANVEKRSRLDTYAGGICEDVQYRIKERETK
jgi:hypothetical protein